MPVNCTHIPLQAASKPKGYVRATPFGHHLDEAFDEAENAAWRQRLQDNHKPLQFPKAGFDHVCDWETVRSIDTVTPAPKDSKKIQKLDSRVFDEQEGHEHGNESMIVDSSTKLQAPVKTLKDKWRLLPYFLQLRGLMKQHVSSYDHFVNVALKQIILSPSAREIRSDHDPKFYLRYTNIYLGKPDVEEDNYTNTASNPAQCRLRNCTYSAPIFVDIRYTRGGQVVVKKGYPIGRMPVMLRSSKCVLSGKSEDEMAQLGECPHDPGGYFIIRGVEKVILMQEQLSKNRVIIETDTKGFLSAQITTSTNERKSRCSIFLKKDKIYLKHNIFEVDMPICVVMKAMGLESDMECVQLVGSELDIVPCLASSIEECYALGIHTQHQALRFIGSKVRSSKASLAARKQKVPREDEAREILANVILSHIPVENFEFRSKCIYVAHIMRRILLVHLGKSEVDDKDYYGNKRIELAGSLLALLFEDLFKHLNKDVKTAADKVLSKPNRVTAFDVLNVFRQDIITNGMNSTISTGNWVIKRFNMDRAGVTQVLSRLSYLSALGMMTRVNSHFEKTRKVAGPRSLQPSQWGMLCPSDTPEGEACGLVKNLALLAHITTDEEPDPIMRLCMDLGVEDCEALTGHEINSPGAYLVLLNGNIVGVHVRPHHFIKQIRTMRRQGFAGEFLSVYLHESAKTIHISSDGGRLCRPLIIVDSTTGRPKLKQAHIEALCLGVIELSDLMRQGVIEYVDVNEESNCLIALTERDLQIGVEEEKIARQQGLQHMPYTHLEIDPVTIMGIVVGTVAYPHHNQSPRNTYQSAMAKQAMGCTGLNQYARMDGLNYAMVYPMKPMVKTRTLDLVDYDKVPGGQNICIAVMAYSGYDIEDAVILNKASVDRGFARCMVFKKQETSIKRYANRTMDRTCAPPDPKNFTNGKKDRRYQRYSAIDIDGICMVGEKLDSGSVMVNKESPMDITNDISDADFNALNSGMSNISRVSYKPSGVNYKGLAPSYVDKVLLCANDQEHQLIKILHRQTRRPEVGDKFASRHGQKGVCGLIAPQTDLPFNEMGISPDLIMNPHGFPSRMTVGKLLELLVGKASIFEGRQGFASAFGEERGSADTPAVAREALVRNGFNYNGKDLFYSGTSGEPLDAYIFSGPIFYQKLKHMVLDKMHARARGPRAVLTRQPTEGRARDGGLRLGEMERDCLIAYGASNLIMERLMYSSDAFNANVCMTCGMLQYQNWCQYCRSGEQVAEISLPYACKLLFQELQSMNVLPKLRLENA